MTDISGFESILLRIAAGEPAGRLFRELVQNAALADEWAVPIPFPLAERLLRDLGLPPVEVVE